MRSVQQVVYGDRLILDNGESVQALGVWAPKPDPGKKDFKPDSAMGAGERRSREFTQGLLQGRQVWLTYGEPAKDSQGNSLALIYFKVDSGQSLGGGGQQVSLGAGTYMLNQLLLSYGFAEADNKANTSYKVEFQQLQSEAVRGKRGNWQMMTP
ncbi:MAG TPA: thermonuclease family protein [bacterium]|nr:thermonuclease family protein [bacterium]